MIGSVVDLQFLIRRLEEVSRSGLTPYVVDAQGRLVATSHSEYATGQDMKNLEIVRNFVDEGNKAQLAATKEFTVQEGKERTEMLGTYSPVTALDWAVVVQKPRLEAYRGVFEMQHTARLLALAGGARQHHGQLLRSAAHHESSEGPDRIQPGHRPRRFLQARRIEAAALKSANWPPRST